MDDLRLLKFENIEAWRAERAKRIGSSDAAALFGASPWKTPLQLYMDKTLPGEIVESEAMEWGRELEEPIARQFARRTKFVVVNPAPFSLYVRDSLPQAHASPDRFLRDAIDNVDAQGVLEIKTTAAWKGEEWDETVPLHYQVQIQHQLLVLGLMWGFVSVLIGGQKLRSFEVRRDPLFCEALEAQIVAFMRRVEAHDPPPASGAADYETVRRQWRKATSGKVVGLNRGELVEAYDAWLAAKEEKKKAEELELTYATKLISALGDAELGVLPDGRRLKYANEVSQWKAQEARTIEKRVLRALKPEKD